MGSSLSLKPKPPRTNSKKNMLITLTRRASRAMSSRRAWLSTSGGDADGGGMGQEPGKDPEVLAARRRENMEAFKAFRKVARGFRWPNEAAPSSTTKASQVPLLAGGAMDRALHYYRGDALLIR